MREREGQHTFVQNKAALRTDRLRLLSQHDCTSLHCEHHCYECWVKKYLKGNLIDEQRLNLLPKLLSRWSFVPDSGVQKLLYHRYNIIIIFRITYKKKMYRVTQYAVKQEHNSKMTNVGRLHTYCFHGALPLLLSGHHSQRTLRWPP